MQSPGMLCKRSEINLRSRSRVYIRITQQTRQTRYHWYGYFYHLTYDQSLQSTKIPAGKPPGSRSICVYVQPTGPKRDC